MPNQPSQVYIPLGYQQISAATLASATSLTVPAGSRVADIQVDTATVRYRDDGTAPTTTVGVQLFNGLAPFSYSGDLTKIQFIAVSGAPVLNVTYYR